MQQFTARWITLVLAFLTTHVVAETLTVRLESHWSGKPLPFGEMVLTNSAGQALSVTRLDFLLSDFALRSSDGAWLGCTNEVAFLSFGQNRTCFELRKLPTASYDRIRFRVGLRPEVNHAETTQYPAGHPLNPTVNGLHWSWQGGYVFLALEGNWIDARRRHDGYSFHIATDRQLMFVELPLRLDLNSAHEVRLALDAQHIISQPNQIRFAEFTTSTHSRADDVLAEELRRNIEEAFTVLGIAAASPPAKASASGSPAPVVIASNATPYRLAISCSFPRPALPLDNPLTVEGVELGRRLFNEPLLSFKGVQSCASCHQPDAGFAEPGKAASVGAKGQRGTRNSMSLFNLAWKSAFFWDGRASSLRQQVLMPIESELEMGEALSNVVVKLAATEEYPALFEGAFGSREIDSDRIARALEQFLITQISHDSKFDRFLYGQAQLTESEQRGFELFHTEYDPRRGQFGADCFHCHGGPLFQSQAFANNGLNSEFSDSGRFAVTQQRADLGKFAVPSLRNVELTAPYMHDGRIATLEAVVEHYITGVKRSSTLDPNLAKHPDGGVPLNQADKQAIAAFLRTLTDEGLLSATVLTPRRKPVPSASLPR
jgi:cytochrome c peroxidase